MPFAGGGKERALSFCVTRHLDACDIFIGVAAVADYRPNESAAQKIKKKSEAGLSLDLVQNPDIIAAVARSNARPIVVGFAAETQDAIANARTKLVRKALDMIVVNDVSDQRIGFNSDDNAVTVITVDGEERIDIGSKTEIARAIIDRVARAIERAASSRRAESAKRTSDSDSASG